MKDSKSFTVELPEDLARPLRLLAAEAEVSRGELIRRILRAYLIDQKTMGEPPKTDPRLMGTDDTVAQPGVSST